MCTTTTQKLINGPRNKSDSWRPRCRLDWALICPGMVKGPLGAGGMYFPAGDATATRECRCREGDVLDPQQCLDGWEEYNKKIKALQFTWCKRNQASIRVARSPSHGGLTSQLIGLKGSATNALVLDTTGQLQRSYVQIGHVLAQIDLIGI